MKIIDPALLVILVVIVVWMQQAVLHVIKVLVDLYYRPQDQGYALVRNPIIFKIIHAWRVLMDVLNARILLVACCASLAIC